jgi:hypothetical protein
VPHTIGVQKTKTDNNVWGNKNNKGLYYVLQRVKRWTTRKLRGRIKQKREDKESKYTKVRWIYKSEKFQENCSGYTLLIITKKSTRKKSILYLAHNHEPAFPPHQHQQIA